jgi:hypothetical protein
MVFSFHCRIDDDTVKFPMLRSLHRAWIYTGSGDSSLDAIPATEKTISPEPPNMVSELMLLTCPRTETL